MTYSTIDYVHPALDLVNSRHGTGPDLLQDRDWVAGYVARWGLEAARPPGPNELERLSGLRETMRRVVEAVAAGEPRPAVDLERLNRALGAASLRRELAVTEDSRELRLLPARRDWTWALSEVAASLATLLADGEPERLKVCDDDECRFAFYDASKNRARRWCSHTTCGNRHKLRRYRERRRYSASR